MPTARPPKMLRLCVSVTSDPAAGAGAASFARPKSRILICPSSAHQDISLVLKSRWITPGRMARAAMSSGDERGKMHDAWDRESSLGNQPAERLPRDEFHHDAFQIAVRKQIVDRHDARVIEGRTPAALREGMRLPKWHWNVPGGSL